MVSGTTEELSVHDVIKTRHKYLSLRIFCAELFGTILFIFVVTSTMAQVMIGSYERAKAAEGGKVVAADVFNYGDILMVAIGNGVGLTMATALSGTISGAHLNPAVTVAHVFFQKIHWAILPVYIIAQCFGTFVGMGFSYTVHAHKLTELAGDDVEIQFAYFTSPLMLNSDEVVPQLLWDQVLGSAIFMCFFFANEETRSTVKFRPLRAINVGGCYGLLILSIGINAMSSVNPVRDMVPRIFFYTVGYNRAFSSFVAITFLAPFFGCLLGGGVYSTLIGNMWPDSRGDTDEVAVEKFMFALQELDNYTKKLESGPRRSHGGDKYRGQEYVLPEMANPFKGGKKPKSIPDSIFPGARVRLGPSTSRSGHGRDDEASPSHSGGEFEEALDEFLDESNEGPTLTPTQFGD